MQPTAHSKRVFVIIIYTRGRSRGPSFFWLFSGLQPNYRLVRIGTLDCKFDPNPNRDTACTSLQVWSSVEVYIYFRRRMVTGAIYVWCR